MPKIISEKPPKGYSGESEWETPGQNAKENAPKKPETTSEKIYKGFERVMFGDPDVNYFTNKREK